MTEIVDLNLALYIWKYSQSLAAADNGFLKQLTMKYKPCQVLALGLARLRQPR
jgi:hypothetical protein